MNRNPENRRAEVHRGASGWRRKRQPLCLPIYKFSRSFSGGGVESAILGAVICGNAGLSADNTFIRMAHARHELIEVVGRGGGGRVGRVGDVGTSLVSPNAMAILSSR